MTLFLRYLIRGFRFIISHLERTTVEITKNELLIRKNLLPSWLFGKKLKSDDLRQIYCEERKEGLSFDWGFSKNFPFLTIKFTKRQSRRILKAVTKDNKHLNLLTKIYEPATAKFIKQQIEEKLGIISVKEEIIR